MNTQETEEMKLTDATSKADVQQALDEADVYVYQEDAERKNKIKASIISWVSSLSLHLAAVLIAINIGFLVAPTDTDAPPVHITLPTYTLPPPDKSPKIIDRDIIKTDVLIETPEKEEVVQDPIAFVTENDIKTSTENNSDEISNDIAKGREEAKADMEMGGSGVMSFIGAGGGSSGLMGNRNGVGKQRTKAKMGSQGRPAEAGQEAGLRWLMRHQSPEGKWSAERYYLNCTVGNKCEPGKVSVGDTDIAMTGYALLCYAGAGYDQNTPNKYRKVVRKGIDYLLSCQKPDGLIGERNYEHPIATMAIIELYGATNDVTLRDPAQKAINVILSRQGSVKGDDYSRVGWDYVQPNPQRCDGSVSGWNIMALKSAYATGFNVTKGLDGAKNYLEHAWKASNPNWEKLTNPYTDTSVFPYTWNAVNNKVDRDHMSFVGATCAVFLGWHSGNIMFETMLNDANARWIDSGAYKTNIYAGYYLSMADFQAGGDRWQKLLNTVIPYTIEQQKRSTDCFDGSWDWQGQSWHGADTGRVLSTCYNILNLEVAYRYVQVNPDAAKQLKINKGGP